MTTKKTNTLKLFALMLCLFIAMPSGSITALNLIPGTPIVDDETELLSTVLDAYFESRTYTSAMRIIVAISDFTNPGMPEDEVARMQAWQSADVLGITNSYMITQASLGDGHGTATITETINYLYADRTVTQSVVHYMEFLSDQETDSVHILMDSYTEPFIEFTSCSYLPEYTMEVYSTNTTYGNETATNTHVNTGDFSYDITQIALTQVGYLEKESNSQLDSKTANAGDGNWTKYNRDIGYNGSAAWCASFVAWCAQEAGLCIGKDINTDSDDLFQGYIGTVIPNEKKVSTMAKYYRSLDRFYSSSSYTPQIGDIFFMQGNGNSHVGLVVEVTSSQVKVVHGNSSEQVKYSIYTLSSSSITGYSSPDYALYSSADASHIYHCANHTDSLVHTCNRCDKVSTATWQGNHPNTLIHTCSLCNHNEAGNSSLVICEHDANEHWSVCTVCNATWGHGQHLWIGINDGNDGYRCKICGRISYGITLDNLTPPPPAFE